MTNDKRIKESNPARYQLLGKVAWLYYHEGLTQVEIAEQLGISRITINRLIREARDSGIVEIKIHTDQDACFELAQKVRQKYGLRDAICVQLVEGEELSPLLAQAAGSVLEQRLQEGMLVGIGIGRTISHLPDNFKPSTSLDCRFIGLTGGLDLTESGVPHTFNTLARLASLTGGSAVYIPAPSYMTDPSAQRALMEEGVVVSALETAANSQIAVFSVGAADYTALLYQYSMISDEDVQELRDKHAVGDIIGRFFDDQGQELEVELNNRIIGLHLEQLKRIPLKILVAGGENKRKTIRTALLNRYCDILITGIEDARWLVEA